MNRISITGTGAVSPAGWGVEPFMQALGDGRTPEPEILCRSHAGIEVETPVLRVPKPADRSVIPKHPRLRRASPLARYLAAAAAEALGAARREQIAAGELRLGIICVLVNGCVNYSNRFYGEVLDDPSLASPILFPETVFNAPSSHLSALFGATGPNDTLIGDASAFFPALELAADWLGRGDVDACLVVGGEETDWLSAEALRLHSRRFLPSEGAGALLLEAGTGAGAVELAAVPDPVSVRSVGGEAEALRELRDALGVEDDGATLLVDGRCGVPRRDRHENEAWSGWRGLRYSPLMRLGEAMGASAPWQALAAVEAVRRGAARRSVAVYSGSRAAGMLVSQSP